MAGTGDDVVTVERTIAAPPEAIFAIVADPARHPEIDGSGSVIKPKQAGAPLKLGSTFGMSMRIKVPYSMVSTVIEFEPNRVIAWQTRGPGPIGRHVGGRIWRYELEPVEGGTLVRESWDMRAESALTRPFVRKAAEPNRHAMTETLARLDKLLAAPTAQ